MPKDVKTVAVVAAGVIVAGLVMYFGAKNDIPGLTHAREGFDA